MNLGIPVALRSWASNNTELVFAPERCRMKIFLCAGLSSLADRLLNQKILEVLSPFGFEMYLPEREIPAGTSMIASEILGANVAAIDSSDLVIAVLDKPGLGVAFELGFATAKGKRIVIFRSDPQDYLGKILEGLYEQIPRNARCTSLAELQRCMERYAQVTVDS